MRFSPFFLAISACIVTGCAQPEPEVDPAAPPKQPAFEGQMDPAIAGVWKSTDGASLMTLKEDGTMGFDTDVNTPGGKQKVKITGKWLTKDAGLLLQNLSSPQSKVIAYTYHLIDPQSLELSLSFPKTKTLYKKQ